jgi:cellulose synthase/poly-beta-1,6-N-acetylglucosamine synthase-like glycosyltransferase
MTQLVLGIISIPVIAILLIFTIRRWLFLLTILFIQKGSKGEIEVIGEDLPSVLVLIAGRDEAGMIRGLANSLRQLEYPQEKFQVVLIDDGSTDETANVMREEAEQTTGWNFFKLSNNLGKAGALNSALAHDPFGELIYILDVDHRPDPQALRHLAQYFEDSKVAAVTGFTKIVNPLSSPSAYYSTIESYINQLVTMRAKDRLRLAPALLGSNCGYRRKTLTECGGFRQGAFSEDSDLTITFYRAGYKVRFAEDVVSCQQVPGTIRGYLKQHIRWGRGLNDVTKTHSLEILRKPDFPFLLRLELLLFSSGYLDRLAVIGAGFLMIYSYLSGDPFALIFLIVMISLLTPFAQILGLFIKEHIQAAMWIRLPLLPLFFALDIFAASRAMLDTVLDRSRSWSRTERIESP